MYFHETGLKLPLTSVGPEADFKASVADYVSKSGSWILRDS